VNLIDYALARPLIEEGDVLLFRNGSKLLQRSGGGEYSHCAVSSWHNGSRSKDAILECVEFREGSFFASLFNKNAGGGGRSTNLDRQVQMYDECIDVYRPVPFFSSYTYNAEVNEVQLSRVKFNPKLVTRTMRQMTGLPYGWRRIWWMAKQQLVGFRLFYSIQDLVDDKLKDVIYPVCSTALAYAFSKNGYDLIPNRSDEFTQPSEISRSSRLSYLFTLKA